MGVMEEKTNPIAEVIVYSVKPFQMMLGKILGIGLVALTQFLLWIIFMIVIYQVTKSTSSGGGIANVMIEQTQHVLTGVNLPLILEINRMKGRLMSRNAPAARAGLNTEKGLLFWTSHASVRKMSATENIKVLDKYPSPRIKPRQRKMRCLSSPARIRPISPAARKTRPAISRSGVTAQI